MLATYKSKDLADLRLAQLRQPGSRNVEPSYPKEGPNVFRLASHSTPGVKPIQVVRPARRLVNASRRSQQHRIDPAGVVVDVGLEVPPFCAVKWVTLDAKRIAAVVLARPRRGTPANGQAVL